MDSHFITVSVSIPADLAKILLSRDCPHAVTLYPEQIRLAMGVNAPDPRERFSELDTMIASVVDEHGPVQAAEIVRLLDEQHGHITEAGSIRKRFMRGMPLKDAGYASSSRGYMSPEHDAV